LTKFAVLFGHLYFNYMEIDWEKLPFSYMKTPYNIRSCFRNGEWGKMEVSDSEYFQMHISATALHYGQECFEGLKAYRGKDGRVRLFRWRDNAKRLIESAEGILMEPVPEELFYNAIVKAVELNKDYIPPYGTGATLYIRPVLLGTGPRIGVRPSDEYMFIVYVIPVGPYFPDGFKPTDVWVCREFDRSAPLGTGNIKVGGNYAASLRSMKKAHDKGYTTVLYLDAKEKKYIDECGPANFFGIKGNSYVTPKSTSILPSITNKSLMELAASEGMAVEERRIPIEELSEFDEAGACGTAAVVSPIGKIIDDEYNKIYSFSKDGNPGPVCEKFFRTLKAIQFGEVEDKFGWITILDI
jgi:branched-chain amino acid aminotransferase